MRRAGLSASAELLVIARQHVRHAECDNVLPFCPSVRPSVRHAVYSSSCVKSQLTGKERIIKQEMTPT